MEIISHCERETLYIGKSIAKKLEKGDIILLCGKLGSGKTVLTKGIAQGLGIGKEQVASPTFVLIREYLQGRLALYHFDLYRLKDAKDILALGYEEYLFGEGVAVIEWAEKLKCLLPKEFLRIELTAGDNTKRKIKLTATGRHYKEILNEISKNISH